MSWDLDDLNLDWDTIKRFDSSFVDNLFNFYKTTDSYQRHLALNLPLFEFTTNDEIYKKSGIYSIQFRRTDNKVTLVGSTDLLFNFLYSSFTMEIISLGTRSLLAEHKNPWIFSNLNYLISQNIFIDLDILNESLILFPNWISTNYYFDDMKDVKRLVKYVSKSGIKFDKLYLLSHSSLNYSTSELYLYINSLTKSFGQIYFVITPSNLSRFFNKGDDVLNFIFKEMSKYNIKFKVFDEFNTFCSFIDYNA